MTVGAKDVSPFDAEAEKFSCCRDEMNLWDPICLEKDLVKCAEGQSCRMNIAVTPNAPVTTPSTDGTANIHPAAAVHKRKNRQTENPNECVHQTAKQLLCSDKGVCFCGLHDNFSSGCNNNAFLRQLRYKICPIPTGQKSGSKCTEDSVDPTDPYCHYDVVQTATGELQFVLKNHFCNHSTYDLAEIQERKWPPVCTKGEKPDTFECKCVGADCVRHKLEKVLKPPGNATNYNDVQ